MTAVTAAKKMILAVAMEMAKWAQRIQQNLSMTQPRQGFVGFFVQRPALYVIPKMYED
jgi:hypothetical protein